VLNAFFTRQKKGRCLVSKKRKTKSKVNRRPQREILPNKCIFCGSTDSIEKHHCVQRRFGGPDHPDNLVPICSRCHRTYHFLSDINLNHILKNRNIEKHEIRETIPPTIQTIQHEEPSEPKLNNHVTITNSTVTINYR
jgi:5-methylcytosine-specific restriction endonuclease McrA